ncbi:hypothetical protein shim_23680 [Shimia sp. SK013]|uniref:hypothetical protein n=1 Tax=Shimia sp. SK013 TaxID=1389006 RepID=UPI0006B55E2B|nr:hypothetical protein [Shimia sp. SK013]KPA21661.1 hypothetical protein shim_23680 [Shimia sp. SK013]
MGPGELIAVVIFAVVAVAVILMKEQKLNDPSQMDTIFAHQMRDVCGLKTGPVSATLFRQSGNLYRDLGLFNRWEDAVTEIEKSFRRAKIDSVYVQENTSNRFEVIRLHHSHRGRAEGKKLGGAVIASEVS